MMKNFDEVLAPASCELRHTDLERRVESGGTPDQDDRVVEHPVRTSSSGPTHNPMVFIFCQNLRAWVKTLPR